MGTPTPIESSSHTLRPTTLISHHVQPRSRGKMTRSSPPPRRFYEVISSQQLDTHGVDSTSGLSQEKKTERKIYFPDQRERPTIFLGAYDNLLERETLTEMQRTTHKGVSWKNIQVVSFFMKRERERGLPRREILLWSPPPRVGGLDWFGQDSCTSHRDHKHRHKGKEKKFNGLQYHNHETRRETKRKFNILSFPFFLLQIFTTLQA